MCPICGNKTRLRIRVDTILKNFPLYCPKCKNETLINVQKNEYNNNQRARRQDAEPII
ncbi:cysteine-rich KTR domain-containing protein [Staphylococcus aureus]